MNIKKIIATLIISVFIVAPASCFAQNVSDSVLRTMVSKYKAQNYTGCIQMSDEIIKKNPSNIYAYYYKGLSLLQLGKDTEAYNAFDKAETLNSNTTVVNYAKRAKVCIKNPENCSSLTAGNSDLDKFIKSNKFYDKSVQAEINKKKLDRIKDNINDDLSGKKKSEMPTNDEIAEAVKTLAKLGINPMSGMNSSYTNPEIFEMNMLLGNNNQAQNGANYMLPMLLMNQNGTQKMSPELIQTMMMTQMTQMY